MEKNRKNIINKKLAGIGAVALVCAGIIIAGRYLEEDYETVMVDSEGIEIAKLIWQDDSIQYECKTGYEDYINLAGKEAIDALSKIKDIDESEAGKELARDGYKIHTSFKPEAFKGLEKGSGQIAVSPRDAMAIALSDGEGHLIATYTKASNDTKNPLTDRTYAGSTIKPLSTYGPAIEEGMVTWSSLYTDSAFEESKDIEGNVEYWPVNTGEFTNKEKTVAEALQESNNAITVKLLNDYGLNKSCTYLEETLGMDVEKEKQLITEDEEKYKKELLSSLGMGYLARGVTVKEMLENYQAFAKEGIRYQLTALESLEAADGTIIYKKEEKTEQIFSEDTAYIMNRMLHGVVQGGTGISAQIDGIDVCGKTGTSENYQDNWFIGMTPEYVCAVWYSSKDQERVQNAALMAFHDAVSTLTLDTSVSYPVPDGVVEKKYCEKTGLLAGKDCKEIKSGYYKKDELPGICNE